MSLNLEENTIMQKLADLTVITPNYNHAHFLPEYFNAIFSQSLIPKELLIIDDASTDDSLAVIKKFQKKHQQIRCIQNSENQGPSISANRAIPEAKGTYLAFLSADDLVLPGFFEEGTKWLDHYPKAGLCCSDPSFFQDNKPYLFSRKRLSKENKVLEIPPSDFSNQFISTPIWIASHASLFRKEFVIKHHNFPEGLFHLADWYFNIRIAIHHGMIYVPNTFAAFRLSRNSYGARLNRSYQKKIVIYQEVFKYLAKEPREVQKIFLKSGVLGLGSSDILLYLLLHPRVWAFLPHAFFRKSCNFFRKITAAS
jgi:glycosyltransferase involved in cell wall biosynthesis